MPDNTKIRELVETIVAEAFDAHMRALHDDVVSRVLETIERVVPPPPEQSPSESLKLAIEAVESASQQTEILNALLDGTVHFAVRTALFVLRGPAAVGWQARGFNDNEGVRTLSISSATGILGNAVHQRTALCSKASQFDQQFINKFGAPTDGACVLLPLIIRDKVAGLIYADSGTQDHKLLDASALDILTRAAGLWIELNAFRKAATPAHPRTSEAPVHPPAPIRAVEALTPTPVVGPTMPAKASEVERVSEVPTNGSSTATAVTPMEPAAVTAAAIAHQAPVASPDVPRDEEEIHRKARRFAKLLVDEIMLYNREKVLEGRLRHDLYERLKDDIDKSRATYDKRYGQTAAAGHDYFTQALVSGLADHNSSLLGSAYERASS